MIKPLLRLFDYVGNFSFLAGKFLGEKPLSRLPLVFLAGVVAIVYPLPFIFFASLLSLALNGESLFVQEILGWRLVLGFEELIVFGTGAAVSVYGLKWMVGRQLVVQGQAWQRSVFAGFFEMAASLNRFDRMSDIPPVGQADYFAWLARASTACTQIVLLFTYGLHTFVVILVLAALLFILQAEVLLIAGSVLVMFLPIYAIVFTRITRVREEMLARSRDEKILAKRYLAEISKNVAGEVRRAALAPSFGDHMTTVLAQHRKLLSLNLVAAAHVVSTITAFGLFAREMPFAGNTNTFLLLGAMLVLVNNLGGILQFTGNMMRNYENVAELARGLRPLPRLNAGQCDLLLVDGPKLVSLFRGDWVLVPDGNYKTTFDLWPLARMLQAGNHSEALDPVLVIYSPQNRYEDLAGAVVISAEEFRKLTAEERLRTIWFVSVFKDDRSLVGLSPAHEIHKFEST